MYYDYSTPRLLTMEFCEGEHIDDMDYMIKNNIDRHDVSDTITVFFHERFKIWRSGVSQDGKVVLGNDFLKWIPALRSAPW